MEVVPFEIRISDETINDLRTRIRATRWPDPAPGAAWRQGTDLGYLQSLLGYWADGFDWRARERELNRFDHFRADVDGVPVHFVHLRAGSGGARPPILLNHGWPSTFVELLPLASRLAAAGFDVVVPSLPGYGFTPRPARPVTYRYVAGLWHGLMRGLGYERYGAHGGDFGAGVATYLALDRPDAVLGLHLTNLEIAPYTGPDAAPLSAAERAYVAHNERWAAAERGYSAIQSTRPQTLGYGLTDSPAGLAAWLMEKWRSWTDSRGDADARLGRDFLLTTVTLYWVTGTITSSMRDYFDNRWHDEPLGAGDRVRVPTGIAVCPHQFVPEGEPPREWAERLYDVRRWTVLPAGGHFAPVEEPDLVADDIIALFA
jgi:pimeloyl-ACP methyl ester carboxylesterase